MPGSGQQIVKEVEKLAGPVLAGHGLELVETQYRRERSGWVLRLFIDRLLPEPPEQAPSSAASGVTLDDCTEFSREFGHLLDVAEIIPGPYTLEVSSPGLDRPLKKAKDFKRFAGKIISIKVAGPEGRRKIKGRLLGLENGLIRIETSGLEQTVPYEQAEQVQLVPELD